MLPVPQRSHAPEWMDRADNTRADLEGALRDIELTNRLLGGRKALLRALRPHLAPGPSGRLELLDVGTGSADLPLALACFAESSGASVRITAVDRDPTTAGLAAEQTASTTCVRVVQADAFRLPFAPRSFDVVTASMFLHHFRHEDVVRLLDSFRSLARRAVVINDLRRHWLPYGFIYLVARLTRRHPMYVHDAPLSVLRGFTAPELREAATEAGAADFRLDRRWPFRLVLTLPAAARA
ncbi:MAG: methyltransferase domain-containing protein [bacterium]|nr:methyltransferase domain-containing protein [bacterium]